MAKVALRFGCAKKSKNLDRCLILICLADKMSTELFKNFNRRSRKALVSSRILIRIADDFSSLIKVLRIEKRPWWNLAKIRQLVLNI